MSRPLYRISLHHLRFAFKLTFAIALSLAIGFGFHLDMPRWAVVTAIIITTAPAFIAGGEPFTGAMRHRGLLRFAGTIIGCSSALIIVWLFIWSPLTMLIIGAVWTGVCCYAATVIRIENSYALGLAGITALTIVSAIYLHPEMGVILAWFRVSEVFMGLIAAVIADMVFAPRSVRKNIENELHELLVDHYRLMQICVIGTDRKEMEKLWHSLIQRTKTLDGMRRTLVLESATAGKTNRRLKALHTLSLTLITQACETSLIQGTRSGYFSPLLNEMFAQQLNNADEVKIQLKRLRHNVGALGAKSTPVTLRSWVGAASRFHLLMQGVVANKHISAIEEEILHAETEVKPVSPEFHRAKINFWRTSISCVAFALLWVWAGYPGGNGGLVMVGVVTSFAMRAPDPLAVAKDFIVASLIALAVGAVYFAIVLPMPQQNPLVLIGVLCVVGFFFAIEVQKQRLGMMTALPLTANVLILDSDAPFHYSMFVHGALSQIVGCLIATAMIVLIKDVTRQHTGRVILTQLISAVIGTLTSRAARREENHLPALYQQLFTLLNLFPNDIDRYRLALDLIVTHERLRECELPQDEDLSLIHERLREAAQLILKAEDEPARRLHIERLKKDICIYRDKLYVHGVATEVVENVERLATLLTKYKRVLIVE